MKPPRYQLMTVRRLRQRLEDRVFAVPRLQREFVWNGPKAAALLDSIYRGMPIGSILIWETDRGNCYLLRPSLHVLPHFSDRSKVVWYLIDGQQRLSVLHQSFQAERKENSSGQVVDFGRLCFRVTKADGEEAQSWFSYRRPVEGHYVPVSDILCPAWKRKFRGLRKDLRKRIAACRERLLAYKVPVIFVESPDLEEIRETFIRINSQGMRISSADRAFARASVIDLREKAHDLRVQLPERFRGLDYGTILLGFSFVSPEREPDVGERALESMISWWERRIERDDRVQNQFLDCWAKFRTAFQKALDYLRENFSVLDKDFLPSVNMLATLTVFFYHHRAQPSSRRRAEIRKWFWATGVGQRYSGRGYRQNVLADVRFFKRLALTDNARFHFEDRVDRSDVLKTEYTQPAAIAKAFLCLLASRRPCYLNNGRPVPLYREAARANRGDRHHVFPRGLLSRYGFRHREYNSLCNICFIVAEENQSIGSKRPRIYLAAFRGKRFFARAMRSHLLPYDRESGLWVVGVDRAFRRFRKRRLHIICKAFEDEAGMRLFRRD